METERFFCGYFTLKSGLLTSGILWCVQALVSASTIIYCLKTERKNFTLWEYSFCVQLAYFPSIAFLSWVLSKYDDLYFKQFHINYTIFLLLTVFLLLTQSFNREITWYFYLWIPPYVMQTYLYFSCDKRYFDILREEARRNQEVMGEN